MLLLLALSSLACGPPWRVMAQAVPNPLIGQRVFAVQFIDFRGLRVGDGSESDHVAKMDPDQRNSWVADKRAMNERFTGALMSALNEEGYQAKFAGNPAPWVVYANVDYIEPGIFTYFVNIPSEVHMRVRITNAAGTLVDEFSLRHQTEASLVNPASGNRLRNDAAQLGEIVADYILHRTQSN